MKEIRQIVRQVLSESFLSENYENLNNATEEEQLAAIEKDAYVIEYIDNPSEAVQLSFIEQHGVSFFIGSRVASLLDIISNPSEAVQLAAVKDNGYAIECIDNPSEAVQLAAVKQNGNAITYIKNSSEEVQLAAVNQNGRAIEDIDNPSSKVKAKADLARWMKD